MSSDILKYTIELMTNISQASTIKSNRNFMDFYADKIRQAANESHLLKAMENLSNLVAANVSEIKLGRHKDLVIAIKNKPEGASVVLQWLRDYNKLAVVIVFSKKADKEFILDGDILGEIKSIKEPGQAVSRKKFDIVMKATCTTPLSHGADMKAGNATLFRRMDVLSDTNSILTLPFYAGNAIRGQVRDHLANHFLDKLGLGKASLKLWFFHAIYAGGALAEKGNQTAKALKQLGGVGMKAEGVLSFRQSFPALSILGCAVGNKILSGKCEFGDLRPICKQWGYDSDVSSEELITWTFGTRREDNEEHQENTSMIFNTECLKAGTKLDGGVSFSEYCTELELSALAKGLEILSEKGRLGAMKRADFGGARIEYENLPSPNIYEKYLKDNKKIIANFLDEIGGLEDNVFDEFSLSKEAGI